MAQAHIANYNPTQLNAVRQSEQVSMQCYHLPTASNVQLCEVTFCGAVVQRLSDLYDVGRLSEDLSAMVNVNAQGGDITSADFDWTGSRGITGH